MRTTPDAVLQDEEPPILDPENLPDTDYMELDYLVEILTPEEFRKAALWQYLLLSGLAILFTTGTFYLSPSIVTMDGVIISLILGGLLVFVIRWQQHSARRDAIMKISLSTLSPGITLLLVFTPFLLTFAMALVRSLSQGFSLVLFLGAAFLLFILSERANEFLTGIMQANTNVSKTDSEELARSVSVRSRQNRRYFFVAVAVLSAFGLIALLVHGNLDIYFPGLLLVLMLAVIFVLICGDILDLDIVCRDFIDESFACFASWIFALRSTVWSFPGVHNPSMNRSYRWLLTLAAFFFISVAVLPATKYFALHYSLIPGAGGYLSKTYVTMQQDERLPGLFVTPLSVSASKFLGLKIDPPRSLMYPENAIDEETYLNDYEAWTKKEFRRFFAEIPFGSVIFFVDLAFAVNALFIIPALISLALCFFIPVFIVYLWMSAMFFSGKRTVKDAVEFLRPPKLSPSTWNHYVARLQNSDDALERGHLFIGEHHPSAHPILLDRSVLSGHAYISGDSGSGKTALGITPLLTQLIRGSSRHYEQEKRTDASFVILDLKGDGALFHTVREEAEAAGLPFRWFTSEAGQSSYVFNPLAQQAFEELSEIAMTELQMAALSLEHGEGYGKSYFSRRARNWLYRVMTGELFKGGGRKGERPKSFEEIRKIALDFERNRKVTDKEKEHTYEILSVMNTLAAFPQLNASSPELDAGAIDMADVIESPQVVYFWLPASISSASVREIGKLALYSLLAAAYQRSRSEKPLMNTYCFIDEFQRIAAENFRILLQQARSMKIPMILSNQTPTDLREGANDFFPTVQGNTRLWHSFAASDINHQKMLLESSGEVIRTIEGVSSGGLGNTTYSSQQMLRPRISKNHILEMTDDDYAGVFHLKRGAGYSQYQGYPMVVKSTYSMSEEMHRRREKQAWPAASNQTVTASIKRSELDESEDD